MSNKDDFISRLKAGILNKDRRSLSKAITLLESQVVEHKEEAISLLKNLKPVKKKVVRLGISGAPGVGKSTFIEALGAYLTGQDLTVAVLAIDPSSLINKGSILGDKTRMPKLSANPNAFVRPSPTSGFLGGMNQATHGSIFLCEAFGFDVIIVETVGVGQSEYKTASIVDTFLLLLQPQLGDELQGVKKGILEVADIVVVNKSDGAQVEEARKTKSAFYKSLALKKDNHGLGWQVPVLLASALEEKGFEKIWQEIQNHSNIFNHKQGVKRNLSEPHAQQFWDVVTSCWMNELKKNKVLQRQAESLIEEIASGKKNVWQAALDFSKKAF